jgi:hypothetical protein
MRFDGPVPDLTYQRCLRVAPNQCRRAELRSSSMDGISHETLRDEFASAIRQTKR